MVKSMPGANELLLSAKTSRTQWFSLNLIMKRSTAHTNEALRASTKLQKRLWFRMSQAFESPKTLLSG